MVDVLDKNTRKWSKVVPNPDANREIVKMFPGRKITFRGDGIVIFHDDLSAREKTDVEGKL